LTVCPKRMHRGNFALELRLAGLNIFDPIGCRRISRTDPTSPTARFLTASDHCGVHSIAVIGNRPGSARARASAAYCHGGGRRTREGGREDGEESEEQIQAAAQERFQQIQDTSPSDSVEHSTILKGACRA